MNQQHKTIDAKTQGLARLLQAEYRYIELFRDDLIAHQMIELIAKRSIEQSENGTESFYYWVAGELRGALFRYPKEFLNFGVEGDELVIALSPDDSGALEWATQLILSLEWSKQRVTLGKISGYHQALIPTLYQVGMGIDALGLIGETQVALEQIQRYYAVSNTLSSLGLTLATLDDSTIDDVVSLRERCFKRAPEYCWFGANPDHLILHRERLASDIMGPHAWFVILKGKQLVGHFGSAVTFGNPMWGPVGGLELYFDEDFRGMGIGKFAYQHTLSCLLKHGAQRFKGVTAQKSVMHLSRQMGRQLFEIHLRNDPFFPAEHFSSYLRHQ